MEIVIAMVLICVVAVGAMTGYNQVTRLNQHATTRSAHTEMRTRVFSALSDTNNCALNLGQPSLANPASPPVLPNTLVAPGVWRNRANQPPEKILTDGEEKEGLRYKFAIAFRDPGVFESFPAGFGRPFATYRHSVVLEISAERYILQGTSKYAPIVGEIPMVAEFEQATGKLVNCTVAPEGVDETLAGGLHTVRQCLAIDGTPMPSPRGLICRVPVLAVNQKSYNGSIPSCGSLAPGWNDAIVGDPNPGNPENYNTTVARDVDLPKCKGRAKELTGWHYMSRSSVERKTFQIKKGGAKGLNWMAAGATFVAAGLIGIVIFAIFALFASKCKSESYTLYAQVNGVGCI